MAADFDKPTLDSEYTNVVQDIRDNDKANALMFAGISVDNIPVGAIQFAGGVFGTWNGASFDVTPVEIAGGGTGATTASGARTNLSLSSVAEANALYMKILSNGSDINSPSIFRGNLGVYSTSQVYNQAEVDAIVAFSSQAQAEAGTNTTSYMNPLRTSQAIQAIGRNPITIWTGSSSVVSDGDILSDTGFTVVSGRYFVTGTGFGDFSVDVRDISVNSNGSSRMSYSGSDLVTIDLLRQSSALTLTERIQGSSATFITITSVYFTPL